MPSYREVVEALSPTHYWRMDETSGATAADFLGTANGTYNGAPTLNASALIAEGAAVTFGGNKNITVADDATFKNLSSLSIAFTMNLTGSMNAGASFVAHHATHPDVTAGAWWFNYWDTWLFFGGGDGAASHEISQIMSFDTGARYHVGMAWTGSIARFYVDGSQVGADQAISGIGGGASTATVTLAGESLLGWFPGTMDELVYWKNTALTSANFTAMNDALDVAPGGGGGGGGVPTDPDRFAWNASANRWDAQIGHVWTGSAWLPAA